MIDKPTAENAEHSEKFLTNEHMRCKIRGDMFDGGDLFFFPDKYIIYKYIIFYAFYLGGISVAKKKVSSKFQRGDKVKLAKGTGGFPEGHPFVVTDPNKTSGIVGGHYYKYVVKVNDMNERNDYPAEYDMPTKYLKK